MTMNQQQQKMQANCWWFWLSWRCSGTMRGASPSGAHPGLRLKPMVAAIGQVISPCRPSGCHVDKFEWNIQNTNKTQCLASNYGTFWSPVVYENFGTQNRPSTQTPWLELKSSGTFLAVKCCQLTKSKSVFKRSRSSLKKAGIYVRH